MNTLTTVKLAIQDGAIINARIPDGAATGARITNLRVCMRYFEQEPEVEELLTRLATAAIRKGDITKETAIMAGIEIYETESAA